MITVNEIFDTKEAAEQFRDEYEIEYPPEGYGTTLSITPRTDGKFQVSGYRSKSCD